MNELVDRLIAVSASCGDLARCVEDINTELRALREQLPVEPPKPEAAPAADFSASHRPESLR
jgi:hypothetical protein